MLFFRGLGRIQQDGDAPATSPTRTYERPTFEPEPVYVPPPPSYTPPPLPEYPVPVSTDYNWDATPSQPTWQPTPEPTWQPTPEPTWVEAPQSAGTQVAVEPVVQPLPPQPPQPSTWTPPPAPPAPQYEDPMSSAETPQPQSAGTQVNVGPSPSSVYSPRGWFGMFRSLTPVQKGAIATGLFIAALGAVAAGTIHHHRKKQ